MAFPDPVVAGETLVVPGIHSIDYVDGGVAGWRIGRDGSASFNNVDLVGNVGAGSGSIANLSVPEVLSLSNYDDVGATLDGLTGAAADTKGQLVAFWDQSDAPLSGITTRIKLIGLDLKVYPNRFYLVQMYSRITSRTAAVTGQMLLMGLVNSDGSFGAVPTTANTQTWLQCTFQSPSAAGGDAITPVGLCVIDTTGWDNYASSHWLRMILTLERTGSGTGVWDQASGTANMGTPTTMKVIRYAPPARLVVMDFGNSGSMNFEGKGYNTTDTPPAVATTAPAAPKTYTKTYYGTWSRTYDGTNATTWDDSPYCYQGYYSSTRGNTRSLVGFNYAQIQSDLSGATVNSCKLGIKGAHAYYNSGFTCYWGTHNYTAKPSTWGAGNVTERRGSVAGLALGESAVINLGTGIGNEFKSGTSKGIAIGPPNSTSLTYYGFIYGATQTGKPYLTISYTK